MERKDICNMDLEICMCDLEVADPILGRDGDM